LFYLGELALDGGDSQRAVSLFEKAAAKDPQLPGPNYRMAQHALSNERPREARAYLLQELDLNVENAATLVSMASMLLSVGDPDHAVQCLLRATGFDKGNADAYYYLGVATANKGHFDDAERFFSRALELHADHEGALRDSALMYVVTGQTDKASERIAQTRAVLPKDLELRMLDYGLRLMRLTDFCGRLLSRLDPRRVWRC